MHRHRLIALAGIVLGLSASSVWAVKAQFWTHEQPKDFTDGELNDLVVNSRGEVSLGRKQTILYTPGKEAEVINALAQAGDGKIYAATGPKGLIYQIDGDKTTEFARLPDGGSILSLLFTQDGRLLAGTGGKQARIYAIDGRGKATVLCEPEGARYVWAMARGTEGEIYAATGVEGKLFVFKADGTAGKVLCDLDPKNLLCLAFGQDGMLYTGTDEQGLIVRINPGSGKSYVLYDAGEPEISAIVVDAAGNVYAATADANAARPGRDIADVSGGTPELPTLPGAASQPATAAGTRSATQSEPAGSTPSNDADEDDSDDEDTSPGTRPGRRNGEDDEMPAAAMRAMMMGRPGMGMPGGAPSGEGNAIYRIDVDGFVTPIFREPVMILGLTEANGTLYAATGNEGRIYAIQPAREETTMLAKLKAKQVTCLLRLATGRLVLGTANDAMLVQLGEEFASKGTLTSKPLDAGQIVKFGRVAWEAAVPAGSKLTVATRSGNVEDDKSKAWEDWSAEVDATSAQQIASAGARFLQYRLTFESTVADATPSLRRLKLARIEENRGPEITEFKLLPLSKAAEDPSTPPEVKARAGGGGGFGRGPAGDGEEAGPPKPDHEWVAVWKAEDPNGDDLEYQLFFREAGSQRWIRTAKELTEPFRIWDTHTVPDGRYELRILADDGRSNPPGTQLTRTRISDPVLVDNTAPEVTLGAATPAGKGRATLNATITDALSPIASAAFTVNSDEKWTPLVALDDIFDSSSEAVSFTIEGLEPGEHRVALRVSDQQGNTRYVTQLVTIAE